MEAFMSGIDLSRRHYEEVVMPLIDSRFRGLPHSAALLGRGSEVLGYDDDMSTDHDWRARCLLFVSEEDFAAHGPALQSELDRASLSGSQDERPRDEVHTLRDYFRRELALDIDVEPRVHDWLTMPEHTLLTMTSGAVFHDEVGLERARDRLGYYPRDVWLYLMVTGWWRIHPEMNLVGRSGYVGDELGSSLIGARLVSDIMRLCFLMERQYAPYSKWFGTAFARLSNCPELVPILERVLRATTWQQREEALMIAYDRLGAIHDTLGLTEPVSSAVVHLWDRPFRVAWSSVPDLLFPLIEDPAVRDLAERWPVGPVDRFRELVWGPRNRSALLALFDRSD
nr:DUF4037 domain-containing protein [uncultured Nocardioides sp.]